MKNKGISLIILVVTIIVLIILAGAVMMVIMKNNPMESSKKAKFISDINTFKNELMIYEAAKLANTLGNYAPVTLQANKNKVNENKVEDTSRNIADIITSMKNTKYINTLEVINGKLVYIGDNETEIAWCDGIIETIDDLGETPPPDVSGLELTLSTGDDFTNLDPVIELSNLPNDVVAVQYTLPNTIDWIDYSTPFTVSENGDVNIKALNRKGVGVTKTFTIDKIDKLVPDNVTFINEEDVKITVMDAEATEKYSKSGIATIKYLWSESSTQITNETSYTDTIENGGIVTTQGLSTTQYLHVLAIDNARNKAYFMSEAFSPKLVLANNKGTTRTATFLTDDGIQREYIKGIKFVTNGVAPSTYDKTWDASEGQNGTIIAYATGNTTSGYDVTIVADGTIYAPEDSSYLFSYCGYTLPTTKYAIDLSGLDTSQVENMSYMFYYFGYKSMSGLNLGDKFYTSQVENMSYMFSACGYTSITSVSLGDKFDTSNVTNMQGMFASCGYTAMSGLNLGDKFDTSKVENMSYMFSACGYTKIMSLSLKDKFDTSNVTNMQGMFANCGYKVMLSLSLGSKFDTSKVENMQSMFSGCGYTKMTSLSLGEKFDTTNVTNMQSMFDSCGYTAMLSLNLGNKFDTTNVTNMKNMFQKCGYTAMTSLNLGDKFYTSNVTNMQYMFFNCGYTAMISLNLGDKFDTSSVTDMSSMFNNCGFWKMANFDLGDKFDTSNVTNMQGMFYNFGNMGITSLDLKDKFNTSNVTNMENMFRACGSGSMQTLNLGNKFDTSKVTNMNSMFKECGFSSLTRLYLGDKFVTSAVTTANNMFESCCYFSGEEIHLGVAFDNKGKLSTYTSIFANVMSFESTGKIYTKSTAVRTWLLGLSTSNRRENNWDNTYLLLE